MQTSDYSLESHVDSATLYLHGAMSVHGVEHALGACDLLPEPVRHLRVDLRQVNVFDVEAVPLLATRIRRWQVARLGAAQLSLPTELAFDVG